MKLFFHVLDNNNNYRTIKLLCEVLFPFLRQPEGVIYMSWSGWICRGHFYLDFT